MFNFEKLMVYQRSLDLGYKIYEVVKKFPIDERYILSSQLLRASDSITLNIAEGSTGQSLIEFNRFLRYSLRSAIEVISCLQIAVRRDIITREDYDSLYHSTEEVIKMISGLKSSNEKRIS